MFEAYKKRLGISNRSVTEQLIQDSIEEMDRLFETSPSYYKVDIEGEEIDSIINKTSNYNIKLIHFKKSYSPKVGSIITHKNKDYLLMEIDSDEIHTFGRMEECNNTFLIQVGESVKERVGTDGMGRPIFKDRYETVDIPCVVRDKYYSTNENAPLPLSEGKIDIYIKYIKSPSVEVNREFEMYGKTYKIADVSYVDVIDEVGVMRIHAERRDNKDV